MIDRAVIDEIRSRGPELLERDRTGKGFICPVCQSGSGKHGTGMTFRNGRFTCWAKNCFRGADIFEVIGRRDGLDGFEDQVRRAAALLGIDCGEAPAGSVSSPAWQRTPAGAAGPARSAERTKQDPAPEVDYSDFYLAANKGLEQHLPDGTYRGISWKTLQRFQIGYAEQWRHPKVNPDMVPFSPRVIIPTSRSSYLARDIRPAAELSEEQKRYTKQKVGPVHTFNAAALHQKQKMPIFIVEGEFDAMSIEDVGGVAVGLGGTGMVNRLVEQIRAAGTRNAFVVWLDDDDPGNAAADKLITQLLEAGVPCRKVQPPLDANDPNEALVKDREALQKVVRDIERDVWQMAQAQWSKDREKLQQESAACAMDGLDERLLRLADHVPTGFPSLDRLLDGGLYPGYHVMGAVSSLGKTTLALQIATQIAAQGRDVLIFSLEMARDELIVKSLSCESLKLSVAENGNANAALTVRDILNQHRIADLDVLQMLARAKENYCSYARHLYIHQAMGDLGTQDIRKRVERHMRAMDSAPVVIVDYMQILAPADVRASDKQNTDRAVVDLKRLSRDFNLPVLGISSFNRANYFAPVNIAGFKESGAIEYTADTLLGLQYAGFDYQERESDKARIERLREEMERGEENIRNGLPVTIQIKVLKQRNGVRGSAVLHFYPRYNGYEDPVAPFGEHSEEIPPAGMSRTSSRDIVWESLIGKRMPGSQE